MADARQGLNAHKLAPQLRTFILEHLTANNAERYQLPLNTSCINMYN
jgi:hypothetical protein